MLIRIEVKIIDETRLNSSLNERTLEGELSSNLEEVGRESLLEQISRQLCAHYGMRELQ